MDNHDDFPPPHQILPTVARPSTKVAGARRSLPESKGKGKENAVDQLAAARPGKRKRKAASPLRPANGKKQRGGRVTGIANYSPEDLDALLDILEESLPLGGNAWNSASDEFNAWAQENGRPSRTAKSLELKFKQLVKTPKPTGDAEVPPHIERAHVIDDLMNDKAGSRDLDDEDIVDAELEVIEVSDSDEKGNINGAKPTIKAEKSHTGPVARRPPSNRLPTTSSHTRSHNHGRDLLENISRILDPEVRRTHAEEHSVSTLQTGQLFTLSSQLRDSQRQIEGLRNQLLDAERRCRDAERRADRAELKAMITESHRSQVTPHPRSRGMSRRFGPARAGWRPHRHLRQEIHYADGGRVTRWLGSNDDEDEIQGNNDSPGTRRYTYEEYDSPDSPSPTCSSLPKRSLLLGTKSTHEDKSTTPATEVISPIHYCPSISL